jgi:hypothetical protein
VVDDRTPALDRDAGSLRVIHALRVLRSLGYRPTFVPLDLKRAPRDVAHLESLGTNCPDLLDLDAVQSYLRIHGPRFPLIYSSRPDPTQLMLSLYRRYAPQAKVVYDTQDLHFVRERRRAELECDATLLDGAAWRRQQELGLVGAVDCTLVVSETERGVLMRERPGARVEVVPLMYEAFDRPAGFAGRADLVFLGGYRHLPNVDAATYFVREVFPLVRARLPGVRFHVIGSDPPAEILDLAAPDVVVHGHVPDLAPIMNTCRVAVHPLRFGAGVKGKILTAMAFGLPGVGTGIAVEGLGLREGTEFLVADEPRAFAESVARLYTDETLWTRLAKAGLTVLAHRHSLECGERAMRTVHQALGLSVPCDVLAAADAAEIR